MYKKIQQGSAEWNFFREFYALREETYDAETEEELVGVVLKKCEALIMRYEGESIESFAREMIMCHLEDCEKRFMVKQESIEKKNWVDLFHAVYNGDADAEEYYNKMNYVTTNQIKEANRNWVKTAISNGKTMDQLILIAPCANQYAA